ncbi:MAG: sensor histidine kinase N-terminal domain-containing protein [Gammaproteobacteria bacterium]|nr:sensor histidine kinase N-terminal domain-containing protein [Gammaproteobacteria bacterium]
MGSIRNTLILWLSLFFSLIWVGFTALSYWTAQREVADLFDAQLGQAAAVLSQIQNLNSYRPPSDEQILKSKIFGRQYEKKIAFQIWDGNKLILRSFTAPIERMSSLPGYSDQNFSGYHWRVFSLTDESTGRLIYTAERYDVRNELIEDAIFDSVTPLSFALPVTLLMIWLTIGRGLARVNRIAREVATLSPQNLDPVITTHTVPREINPLITALNSLFAKLKTAFDRERRFTSDAAHELQTPLASIKTQAQVALRTEDPQVRTHALLKIEEGVNRTSHLVQQLLTLARYDPGILARDHQLLSLEKISAEVIADLFPSAHLKQINISLISQGEHLIRGHNAGLSILIRNLVDNAIRYTPLHGNITVTIQVEQANVVLHVCDNGPGIAPEEREQVFERFYRGDNTQHITGSGLGLSIAQRIALIHQARIYFHDNPDSGEFCVSVDFPVNENSRQD